MTELLFWGEGGAYGPYHVQEDGWPDAGEVMRDYRVRQGMSTEEAAKRYNKALHQLNRKKKSAQNRTITASWILNMENENRVPVDITRRRLLADLLGIPYILFGLATLEQAASRSEAEVQEQQVPQRTVPNVLHHTSVDLTRYEQENKLLWQLHEIGSARASLHNIDTAISHLEALESQARGHLSERVLMLLDSYYQLGSDITREDQRTFRKSYDYANKAVQVTKLLKDDRMIASALETRGYTNLTWGFFGETSHLGVFEPSRDKINAAISDFEQALPYANRQLKGHLLLDLSRVYVHKKMPTDIAIGLNLLDKAEKLVGVEESEDSYIPLKSFNEGMFYLGRAVTLTAADRPERAIEALDELEILNDARGIGRNQLRRRAWIDIQYAQACIGMKEYYEAARRATNALLVCKDISSVINVSIIADIFHQLPKAFSRGNQDVAELGSLLADSYRSRKDHRL